MKRRQREEVMRQGVVLPETPRDRRNLSGLAADLDGSPHVGLPLPLRLRNFRPSADSYLSALGGPRAYMVRLRRIDELTDRHRETLEAAWRELAARAADEDVFSGEWQAAASAWDFDEVNALIDRHNRWYPVESRLPMDPARRDYALVNGRDYRRHALDACWILERFPPRLAVALGRHAA